jgi:uncharacterized membrane protein
MSIYPKNKLSIQEVRKFIVIFYIIGAIGFMIPFSRDVFIQIIPLAILLNVYLLAAFHPSYQLKTLLVFLSIFLLGYLIEVIGVNTGIIFGHYQYGKGLGIKLFDTPLLIGINWIFVTYTAYSIMLKIKMKTTLLILLSPLLMVLYDAILEIIAPKIDMWSWEQNSVPIQNYLAWYLIGLFFVSLIKYSGIKMQNPLAFILFFAQFMFFIFLAIFLP